MSYAEESGILYLETSAKSGQNVQEVFQEIARRLPISSEKNDKNGGLDLNQRGDESKSAGCCGALG